MTNLLKPYGADDAQSLMAKQGSGGPPMSPGKGGPGNVERKSALLAPADASLMAKVGIMKGGADITRIVRKSALLAPAAVTLMAKVGESKGGLQPIRPARDGDTVAMAGKGEWAITAKCPGELKPVVRHSALLAPSDASLMAKVGLSKGGLKPIRPARDGDTIAMAGKGGWTTMTTCWAGSCVVVRKSATRQAKWSDKHSSAIGRAGHRMPGLTR